MNIWSRLGISVAIAALFSIVMTEVFQSKGYYERYKWHICVALITMGVALWIIGRSLNARAAQRRAEVRDGEPREESDTEETDDGQPFLLINLAYWGSMLVVFGIIVVFIMPLKEVVVHAAANVQTNKAPNRPPSEPTNTTPPSPAPVTVAVTPAAFPSVKLQGLVYRQTNPSVMINGRTLFVGDYAGDAKVLAIDERSATLEWNGQRKVLAMEP